jgi:hypothetical protein
MSPLYGPSASAASKPSERSRHTAQPPRKSANGPADKAHRGHADAVVCADCSRSACRHERQNGLPDPSSPQTGHDQGNIKASSASLKAMSQLTSIPRATTDRDDNSPKRKERKEIILDDLKTSRLISALTEPRLPEITKSHLRLCRVALTGQEIGLELFAKLVSGPSQERLDGRR